MNVIGPSGFKDTRRIALPKPKVVPIHRDDGITLRKPSKELRVRNSGIAVARDGSLRIVHNLNLISVDQEESISWIKPIIDLQAYIDGSCSRPAVLDDGTTIVTHLGGLLFFDSKGELAHRVDTEFDLVEYGPSPCITYRGDLIVTTHMDGAFRLKGSEWINLNVRGYDILPPAVYGDDSLAVAGYSTDGFCRVGLDGEKIWGTDFTDADGLPAVASTGSSAVSSLNDCCSRIYSKDGRLQGEYGRPASFAEHTDGGWVAFSDGYIALLRPNGSEVWEHELETVHKMTNPYQAIVDSEGRIYAPCAFGVVCFDKDGTERFEYALEGGSPSALTMVGPGRVGFISWDELVLLG